MSKFIKTQTNNKNRKTFALVETSTGFDVCVKAPYGWMRIKGGINLGREYAETLFSSKVWN